MVIATYNIIKHIASRKYCVVIDVTKYEKEYIGKMSIRPISKNNNEIK